MVNWRDLEAATDRKVGRTFGERVLLKFNRKGVTDPSRPSLEVERVPLHIGGDDSVTVSIPGDRYRTRLSAGEAELFLDRSTYAGPLPKANDEVRALDRAGQPWFEVKSVSDRYSNLIVLSLGES